MENAFIKLTAKIKEDKARLSNMIRDSNDLFCTYRKCMRKRNEALHSKFHSEMKEIQGKESELEHLIEEENKTQGLLKEELTALDITYHKHYTAIEQSLAKAPTENPRIGVLQTRIHNIDKEIAEFLREKEIYQKFTGMSIFIQENGTIFVFDHVSVEFPLKEHIIKLALNHHKEYVLIECLPNISGTEALLESLNRTDDLRAFLVGIRDSFSSLYF